MIFKADIKKLTIELEELRAHLVEHKMGILDSVETLKSRLTRLLEQLQETEIVDVENEHLLVAYNQLIEKPYSDTELHSKKGYPLYTSNTLIGSSSLLDTVNTDKVSYS
jgi:hypothetical protein